MDDLGQIVVGWDGTPAAADALAFAKVIRHAAGGSLTLAAVPENDVDAQAVLDAAHADLPYGGGHRLVPLSHGPPADRLVELATALGASAIVLGPSSKHGPRAALGSVAERVLHSSPCPVAVASPGFAHEAGAGLHVIGAAFDGSPEAWSALRCAEEIALHTGAALRIIGVLEPVSIAGGGVSSFYAYAEPAELSRDRLHEQLDQAAAAVDSSLRPLPVLLRGDPAKEIAKQSAALDLLVMGSRASGPVRRVLVGSTSSRVTHAGASPVLVVPRGAAGLAHAEPAAAAAGA